MQLTRITAALRGVEPCAGVGEENRARAGRCGDPWVCEDDANATACRAIDPPLFADADHETLCVPRRGKRSLQPPRVWQQ